MNEVNKELKTDNGYKIIQVDVTPININCEKRLILDIIDNSDQSIHISKIATRKNITDLILALKQISDTMF